VIRWLRFEARVGWGGPPREGAIVSGLAAAHRSSIWRLPPSGDGKPTAISKGAATVQDQAQLSADDRWLAYRENRSDGTSDVYVRTLPQGDNRWQISTAHGQQPRWRRDGRERFYVAGDQLMMADREDELQRVRGCRAVAGRRLPIDCLPILALTKRYAPAIRSWRASAPTRDSRTSTHG
jgi:hypothetical protein